MIDKRIGKRIKERREQLGITQEELAKRIGVGTNYISTLERGVSFPRCDLLIKVINELETSADSIFCDVVNHSFKYRQSELAERLNELTLEDQAIVLDMVELLIHYVKNRK